MPDQNEDKEKSKKEGENEPEKVEGIPSGFRLIGETEVLPAGYTIKIDITTGKKITNAPVSAPPVPIKPFPEPKVLQAIVDPKEKPKEGPTAFSFTNPQAIQADMTKPTKGDVQSEGTDDKKAKLASLDAEIARDEKDQKDYTYDDYHDTAEMFVDGWESILIMVCRGWSHDTSETAYSFPTATREKLIRQGTKVSRKKGWVMPIEFLAAATLLGATGNVITKASVKRKEYMAKQKEDPANREIIKGGPNKGQTKRRGPGNPR